MNSLPGTIGALWGIGGVLLLLGGAIYRLGQLGLAAFDHPFDWRHWPALALVVLFMAHAEGYRGFQQGFSPRVAARARYLRGHPRPLHLMLAPLFCMGFIHATRKRRLTSFAVTGAIVVLVLLVRLLPQPWRGIVDLGVVAGLGWGLVSLLTFSWRALAADAFAVDPEIAPPGEK